jgi:hypothetical protein
MEPIGMDHVNKIPELIRYGEQMGQKIIKDEFDIPPEFIFSPIPK